VHGRANLPGFRRKAFGTARPREIFALRDRGTNWSRDTQALKNITIVLVLEAV
jgi:hypothetical protein